MRWWSFLSSRRALVGVLALHAIVRLVVILHAEPQSLAGYDTKRYMAEAQNLVHHGVFSELTVPEPTPTAHDLPAFPGVLAALLILTGSADGVLKTVSVLNLICYLLALVGVWRLARDVLGSIEIATAAVLISGLFPESIPYSVIALPDSMFMSLLVWGVVAGERYARTGLSRWMVLCFGLWGLSVLVKPVGLYLGPVICIGLMLAQPAKRLAILICMLAGCLIVAPWLVRNRIVFGRFALSSITGYQLWNYNYRFLLEDSGMDSDAILVRQKAAIDASLGKLSANPVVENEAIGSVAAHELLSHPGMTLFSTVRRHLRFYGETGVGGDGLMNTLNRQDLARDIVLMFRNPKGLPLSGWVVQIAAWLTLMALYVASLIGALRLYRHRKYAVLAGGLAWLGYFALLIGVLNVARYRMQMIPVLAIFSAYALAGPNRDTPKRARGALS